MHTDYVDRWMSEEDPYKEARGSYSRPTLETGIINPFVTGMWKTYRHHVPKQPMSGVRKKWVWVGDKELWVWPLFDVRLVSYRNSIH